MGEKRPLSTRPPRQDLLTDREVARILGGFLGGLAGLATLEDLRNAVRWWAETDGAWNHLGRLRKMALDSVPWSDPSEEGPVHNP